MKSVLLTNFTKSNVYRLGAFLEKHKLYNVHAVIPAGEFTEQIAALCGRYGLNVFIPLSGIENGHESVMEVVKRNPNFEEVVASYPRNKIEILRRSTDQMDAENLIGLAMNWPRLRVRALRSSSLYDSFYDEMELALKFMEQDKEAADVMNISWGQHLENDFDVINYGLLENMGIIGENVCLATTK